MKKTVRSGSAKKSTRVTGKRERGPRLAVIHGPNLNLLGEREPEIYGRLTLPALNKKIQLHARDHGYQVRFFQSNGEGEIIDFLHEQRKWADGIVINPGAYTHYSYAIRDAIAAVSIPTYEVHLSDIHKREKFRRISVIAEVCEAQVSGLGWESYTKAIEDFLVTDRIRQLQNQDRRASPKASRRRKGT